MPISPKLSRQLDEALGKEAAEELVTWIHDMEAQKREARDTLRADLAELRQEMQAGFARLEQQMQAGDAGIRQEIAQLEARFERRFSDLIKWSFVFWVGAVGAVAMLAGALG